MLSIAVVTIIQLLKGSKKAASIAAIKLCSKEYWIVTFSIVPFCSVLLFFLAKKSIKQYHDKKNVDFPFLETDLSFNFKIAVKVSFFGFLVGLLGALTGIGGGIIFSPLFLHMKLDPTVASFTSAFLALITSASSTFQYGVWKLIIYDYSGIAIIFGIVGVFIGIYGVLRYIKKHNKQSIIVFTLVFVLFVAASSLVYNGAISVIDDLNKKKNIWAMREIC